MRFLGIFFFFPNAPHSWTSEPRACNHEHRREQGTRTEAGREDREKGKGEGILQGRMERQTVLVG